MPRRTFRVVRSWGPRNWDRTAENDYEFPGDGLYFTWNRAQHVASVARRRTSPLHEVTIEAVHVPVGEPLDMGEHRCRNCYFAFAYEDCVPYGNYHQCIPCDAQMVACTDCGTRTHYLNHTGQCDDCYYIDFDDDSDEPYEDDDEEFPTGSGTGAPRERCTTCGTYNDHFDELHETFVCQCQAEELKRRRMPVLMVAA